VAQDDMNFWRKCSTCKKPIRFGAVYWICSVSTCNRKRSGMVFCSDTCWDVHVPVMNHRESSCMERKAPAQQPTGPVSGGRPASSSSDSSSPEDEILVVASKLKDYIRQQAGMNTSGNVLTALSDYIRTLSDAAIVKARADGRETVMAQDLIEPKIRSSGVIRRRPA
jgi:histone H3/H4